MGSIIRAAVLRGGRLRLERVPFVLPEGAVALDVAACGVCGSDLRYAAGENAWAKHTLGEQRPVPEAMVLGHEISAWLEDEHGRRLVALVPFYTCGLCRQCRTGRPHLCADTVHHGHGALSTAAHLSFGGFADRTAAYPHQVLAVPSGVSPEEATLLDGLAVAIHALQQAGCRPGATLAIVGAGPIGLSLLQAALFMGCVGAAAVDVAEDALARAQTLGAVATARATAAPAADLAAHLRRNLPEGFDLVFDTSATAEGQHLCLELLARGGTAVFMAGLAEGVAIGESDLAAERRLTTSCNCLPADYVLGLRMMEVSAFRAAPMVTHRFPLDRIQQAFDTAANKAETGACKVVVLPGDGP